MVVFGKVMAIAPFRAWSLKAAHRAFRQDHLLNDTPSRQQDQQNMINQVDQPLARNRLSGRSAGIGRQCNNSIAHKIEFNTR
jgi:hypothetical protein